MLSSHGTCQLTAIVEENSCTVATQHTRSRVSETARIWRAAPPFILAAQLDKTDRVLTVWMDVRRGKEGKTEGAEAGIARRVEEERRRKVRKLTAGGQMESARWGLSKVCMVSN